MSAKIAIVVPVYNEESRIAGVLQDLKPTGLPIYVVDDGSIDRSVEVVSKYKVKLISLKENHGKGYAMRVGADNAFSDGYDAVIFIDGDGQHSSEDVELFLNRFLVGNYDVLLGSRTMGMGVPLVRYLGNKFASVWVNALFGIYVSDLLCGFRLITKAAYKRILWTSNRYAVETEMVIRIGKTRLKYREIPVQTIYFDARKGVGIKDAMMVFRQTIYWKINGL